MNDFPSNIICKTSTVTDGNMSFNMAITEEVILHKKQFLEKFGIPYTDHVAMYCDHGEQITLLDSSHFGRGAQEPKVQFKSEVLVTQQKNLALFLRTADCQPMSFYDPVTQTIALAHISRKTLVQKLVQKTVGFLHKSLGVNPENLFVHIGPSIKKESYAFALPLQEESEILKKFTEIKNGFAYIDLEAASIAQLTTMGVMQKNISISEIDTSASLNYFSYYRMKKNGEPTTARMATILLLK